MPRRGRVRPLAVLLLAGGLALAGCSGDEDPADDPSSTVDDGAGTGGTGEDDDADAGQETAAPTGPPTAPADIPVTVGGSASGGADITIDGEHAGFVSPTGNIACSVTGVTAVCQVSDKTYTAPADQLVGTSIGDCTTAEADAMTMSDQRGAWTCVPEDLTGQAQVSRGGWWVEQVDGETLDLGGASVAVLPYGSSMTVGATTCTSAEDGVTCTSSTLGRSFTISRSGYRYG
jgi:hypothetical protein